jgi:hypothetical protein
MLLFTVDTGEQTPDYKMLGLFLAPVYYYHNYRKTISWLRNIKITGKQLPQLEVSLELYNIYYPHKKHHDNYRMVISSVVNVIIIIEKLLARREI